GKKDFGMIAMSYGNIYVTQSAWGAKDSQTLKAIREAEAYPGVSVILAYSPCIEHGIDMSKNADNQKIMVNSGHWPLYRFDPRKTDEGKNPFQLDSKAPTDKVTMKDVFESENRFRILMKGDPETSQRLLKEAQHDIDQKWIRLNAMKEG
ncbi:MAG: pyruvate:ferredoxin (flavodoxin) oxidoreductase, partial [Fibrobacterales bacterium]